jgi:hypothetical protein
MGKEVMRRENRARRKEGSDGEEGGRRKNKERRQEESE